jgi:hypothetical protein
MSGKAMHASVAILFLIAITLYFLGLATSAMLFGLLGVVAELAAWITWFARRRDEGGSD